MTTALHRKCPAGTFPLSPQPGTVTFLSGVVFTGSPRPLPLLHALSPRPEPPFSAPDAPDTRAPAFPPAPHTSSLTPRMLVFSSQGTPASTASKHSIPFSSCLSLFKAFSLGCCSSRSLGWQHPCPAHLFLSSRDSWLSRPD